MRGCVFGKKIIKVQTIFLCLFLSLRPQPPPLTHPGLGTEYPCGPRWSVGWRREGELCVKCLLETHCGVFSCMGNHFCQAFPHVPYLSHLVSCLGFQLCVISLCQLHKADFILFFPKSKDWAHLARLSCVWLNFLLSLCVMLTPYLLFWRWKEY